MIVAPNSPLRRLPENMDLRQRLYFDGIRYSIEMADVAYSRLRDILHKLSIHHATPGVALHSYFAPALLDAWSIIDSVERLRGLLRQTPGIKQKSPNLVVFDRNTGDVEMLRNSVQHLNHEIDDLLKNGLPVWGALSWAFFADDHAKKAKCFTLVAGTMYDRKPDQIVNPAGRNVEVPVGLVTLTATGKSICLSDILERVAQLTAKLEEQLMEQFVNLPPAASDMLLAVEIEFGKDQQGPLTNEGQI